MKVNKKIIHRNSKPKELYGTLSIKEGKIEDYKGPLTLKTEIGYGVNSWASGVDLGYYPRPRTCLVGVNLKF